MRLPSTTQLTGKLSTVHKGTQFEQRAQRLLLVHLSMALDRIGGKGDGGVDLQGWWWLPNVLGDRNTTKDSRSSTKESVNAFAEAGPSNLQYPQERITTMASDLIRIRVLAQCKAERKKLGPHYIRELEGTFSRYADLARVGTVAGGSFSVPPNAHTSGNPNLAMAVLISESAFSEATKQNVRSSRVPFLLIHLPPRVGISPEKSSRDDDDHIGGAIWNDALAGRDGILKDMLELRWERTLAQADGQGTGRPALWWRGGGKFGNYIPEDVMI